MRLVPPAGPSELPTAVCVIRAETRADGARVFSIATTLDVEGVAPSPARAMTDPVAALRMVAEFIQDAGTEVPPGE